MLNNQGIQTVTVNNMAKPDLIKRLELVKKNIFFCKDDTGSNPFALATEIITKTGITHNSRVCLAATNKAVVAGAIIAAAAGGPGLVVPYALSPSVLAEACKNMGLKTAITNQDMELPSGLREIRVNASEQGRNKGIELKNLRIDRIFLWLFTGGSTGTPKIWPKTVKNLFGEAVYLADKFNIGPEDRVISTVPVNHIYGLLFSVLLPLFSGARVVNETPFFPDEIRAVLDGQNGTILISSPAHYKAMAVDPRPARGLRLAFSSGGFLDKDSGKKFSEATGVGVVEVYGSTETGGIATRCRALGETAWTPFDVVKWAVKEERLLVDSPFLSPGLADPATGFFRTGDSVSDAKNGKFMLLGRTDGVVKVGGERVVLARVREVILTLAGIKDVVVLAFDTNSGRGSEIAALIEGNAAESTIRTRLTGILEPQQMPRLIRVIDRLPRTDAGKTDLVKTRGLLEELRALKGGNNG